MLVFTADYPSVPPKCKFTPVRELKGPAPCFRAVGTLGGLLLTSRAVSRVQPLFHVNSYPSGEKGAVASASLHKLTHCLH
jgi:hypothetical protein